MSETVETILLYTIGAGLLSIVYGFFTGKNILNQSTGNAKMQDLITEWGRRQNGIINQAKACYDWAIENGIAKEQARAVLPEGLTKTRLYMNGTLRSWVHYIELRSENGTQKEHMEVAQKCALEIAKVFPLLKSL